MLENNLTLIPSNKINPYTKVDTANGMPINSTRVVEDVKHNYRPKEFIAKENLRNVYARDLAPSTGFDTEKFLKAKVLLTPVYSYNEAKTKYDMISRIPFKNRDLRTQIDALA
tara:strand:- start:232 stop:570 length:339 start_codon:yes stop_codon:yes gene_type:complete